MNIFIFALPESLNKWLALRKKELVLDRDMTDCIWFHAASGEIEYSKSVIREFKKSHPNAKIAVSYTSPSAERLFKNISDQVDLFFPLPWDRPAAVRKILNALKPRVLIFSRTDFWPELIYSASKQNVKIGVLSFTVNPETGLFQKFILRKLLSRFNFVSCVDSKSADFATELIQNKSVRVDGDTRFDQVFFRLSQMPRVSISTTRQHIVFGSTWPEDEQVLLASLKNLNSRFQFVFSPHEVAEENIIRLENEFKKLNLSCVRLSQLIKDKNEEKVETVDISLQQDVLLVDRIGYLADFYRHSAMAFVGGSFRSRVHSVMEPLCCGNHVLVGEKIKNSPEALRYLNQWVHIVSDSASLISKIEEIRLKTDREIILEEMLKNKNSARRVADYLTQTIL